MRALCLVSLLVTAAGCGADTLDSVTYRRLVGSFDSVDQCLAEGNFAPCYQTLTFCADGRANANLEFQQEGRYQLRDDRAIAKLLTVTVVFDLETASSEQLPGRHPWEIASALDYECER